MHLLQESTQEWLIITLCISWELENVQVGSTGMPHQILVCSLKDRSTEFFLINFGITILPTYRLEMNLSVLASFQMVVKSKTERLLSLWWFYQLSTITIWILTNLKIPLLCCLQNKTEVSLNWGYPFILFDACICYTIN